MPKTAVPAFRLTHGLCGIRPTYFCIEPHNPRSQCVSHLRRSLITKVPRHPWLQTFETRSRRG
jgi:hypothetical protein